MRKSTVALIVTLIILSFLSGIWLLVLPSLDRQKMVDEQENLIAVIEESIDSSVSEPDPITMSENIRYTELEQEKEPVPIGAKLGILTIPKLDMKLPVVEGITEELLKTAIGHVPETAVIGDIGNAVIAGHRNYTYGSMFNRLGEIENGDRIEYTSADGESCLFEVFEIIEIEPGDQIAFVQTADKSIITLYTCTPIYEATHRLLVRAEKRYDLEECI